MNSNNDHIINLETKTEGDSFTYRGQEWIIEAIADGQTHSQYQLNERTVVLRKPNGKVLHGATRRDGNINAKRIMSYGTTI